MAGPDTTVIATRSYADTYNNSISGAVPTTQQDMLDSLAGFQSFADISSILSVDPPVGAVIENRSTGTRYKVYGDTIAGISNSSYQFEVTSGKYLIVKNDFALTIRDSDIDSTILTNLVDRTDRITLSVELTDTVTYNRNVTLPSIAENGKKLILKPKYSVDTSYYYVSTSGSDSLKIKVGNQLASRYYLEDGEEANFTLVNGLWTIESNEKDIRITDVNEFYTRKFLKGQRVEWNGNTYRIKTNPYSPG